MLQSKGNRLCYVKLIYDVYVMRSQSWLVRGNQTHTRIFFKTAKKLQRYIIGCLILFTEVHIKPGCCKVRYIQLAYWW